MNLKKIYRQYKNVLFMAAWSLFAFLGLVFGVVPLANRTLTLWQQERTLSDDVDALRTKAALLESLDEKTIRDTVQMLVSALPSEKSLGSILTTVDAVAGQAGITLSDLSLAKPGSIATESAKKVTSEEAKIGASIQSFTISGRGSFDQIKTFLALLPAVRRIFRLQTISVSVREGVSSVRADLVAFYQPFPETINAARSIVDFTAQEQKTIAATSALPLATNGPSSSASATVPVGKTNPFSP